jgi:pyrimidine operon attenuation protein / uracil phosphoribosyltransferase
MEVILNHQQIQQKITRLGHQIIENCPNESEIFIGGIVGNGFYLAKELAEIIKKKSTIISHVFEIEIDKDEPWSKKIELSMDETKLKNSFIILVDDVINSGKTLQYALMKFLEQPTKSIKTVVLVDRTHRRYPIKADYFGLGLSTTLKNRIEIEFNETDSKAYLL